MPSMQHRTRHFRRDAADRGARPNPAWRRIADPGLAVAFIDVFDLHAADLIGQIVILGTGDRDREASRPKFLQSRKEAGTAGIGKSGTRLPLPAAGLPARRDQQDQPRQVGMIRSARLHEYGRTSAFSALPNFMSTLLQHTSPHYKIADRSRAVAHCARPVSLVAVSSEITGVGAARRRKSWASGNEAGLWLHQSERASAFLGENKFQ